MEIDITEIVVSFIGMLSLIVTGVITPILKKWIKSKVPMSSGKPYWIMPMPACRQRKS